MKNTILTLQKTTLFFLLIFTFSGIFSQNNIDAKAFNSNFQISEHGMRVRTKPVIAFKINYGIQQLELKDLSNYLGINSYDENLQYWGFNYSLLNNRLYFDFDFNFVNSHVRDHNDSVKTKLSGFGMSFNFGYDLLKSSKIDLIPMVGIGYQGLEVEINQGYIKSDLVGINHVKYYMNNPAFIFYLGLEFRVPVGSKSAISIKGGYKLDGSNKKWKYQDDKINVESNVGGVYAQVSLCFGNFKRKGSIAQDAISPIE
mgnify:CR=1 FL=1